MSAKEYLEITRPAILHLLNGLAEYETLYPDPLSDHLGELFEVAVAQENVISIVSPLFNNTFLDHGRAVLAGSILQIAYQVLKQHPGGYAITSLFQKYKLSSTSMERFFCRGRLVHGIPIGLLIYAGRNQYNHWEDGEPSKPTGRAVFQELRNEYHENPFAELIYRLDILMHRPVSHFIVREELKWRTIVDYESDMNDLLSVEVNMNL